MKIKGARTHPAQDEGHKGRISFMQQTEEWHLLEAEAALSLLETGRRGLSEAEARRRRELHGPNELPDPERRLPWAILLAQFKNVLILMLLAATAVSAALGQELEAGAIAVIVLLAVILGFVQEYRAERAIQALRRMAAPTATVHREGQVNQIPARDLVPGDLIELRAGDRIPADARLLEAVNLKADESPLTGESVPIAKQDGPLTAPNLALADRTNLAYSGTVVTYGRGRGVVVATGLRTEFGKIARMLQTVESSPTPLQQDMKRVGRGLAWIALAVVAVIVGLGLLRGQPFLEMLIFGVALAVAAVPEALPGVVTISLAIGLQRLARRGALMRQLPAVETLGCTAVICSDKTGTLTRDEMTVRTIVVAGRPLVVTGAGYEPEGTFEPQDGERGTPPALQRLLRSAALCSDALIVRDEIEKRWKVQGDPTEGALVVAAAKSGLDKPTLERESPRVGEIAFTSESKRMTTLHATPEGTLACAKGAPEVILSACDRRLAASGVEDLDPATREATLERARDLAGQALRVIAVADKPGATIENAENGMIFLGLLGMSDPPRPEAAVAIRSCRQAGIKPVMITGDHPVTARAVARELGLLHRGALLTGSDLEVMSEAEHEREVENIEVYARVSPEHKMRVVRALQKKGLVVAMTGDGVNDAPALKKADIGIAMGITGTDVTREAADMTLTDDNFATIVAAVEEGRRVFGNIRKYLTYLLSSNLGEIGLMAGATLAGLPLPLTAVQILYVNLATDGLPALALAVDPPDPDLMTRRPRDSRRGIFTGSVVALMLAGGLWSMAANLLLFTWLLRSGRPLNEAITMTFTSLVLIQFFKAYSFRSDRRWVLHRPLANRWLNLAILWELGLLMLILYLPFLQTPFTTFGLSGLDWLVVVGFAVSVLPALEVTKWVVMRRGRSAPAAPSLQP